MKELKCSKLVVVEHLAKQMMLHKIDEKEDGY
jgi:hypothetical protein